MIVYGSTLSPFVRKVLAYGVEKGIALTFKGVGVQSPDPDFRAASPFGKMPTFRDGDYMLSDSTAIICYLEAGHPEPALIPVEARARGRAMWFDEFGDTILAAAGAKIFFNRFVAAMVGRTPDLAAAEQAIANDLPPIFDYLEGVIPDSGYLVGDRLTLADLAVASPFVNLDHCGVRPDAATHPRLVGYIGAMMARESMAPLIEKDRRLLSRLAG
jgi:glutathione S-transferase